MLAASDEPEHAEQVEDTSAEPSEEAVFGLAVLAGSVGDRLLDDGPAGAFDERGEKPVHRRKIGQFAKRFGADQLPAAAAIMHIVIEQEPPHPVCEPRLEPFEPAIIARGASARHKPQPDGLAANVEVIKFASGQKGVPDLPRIGRIILPVAIEQLHPRCTDIFEASEKRRRFSRPLNMGFDC